MPNYYYDGSFDGLLTVIFIAYKDRKNNEFRIIVKTGQLLLGLDDINVITNFSKARRVEKAICDKLSQNFLNNIQTCFLSCDKNKDIVIVHTVYKALKQGKEILNSLDEHAFYVNNVLPILISHFIKRMKRERFAIYDKKRKMIAYYDTKKVEIFFVKSLEIEWSDEEIEYSELWKTFHKSISIKERENKKLQQSNLPKYYWKYLIEDM